MVAALPLRVGGRGTCLRAAEGGSLLSSSRGNIGCAGNGDCYSVRTASWFLVARVFSWRTIRSG